MSAQEVVINRMADRVNFLAIKKEWGHTNGVQFGNNEVGVICWLGDMGGSTPVSLNVRGGGFALSLAMNPEQARMVAKAILAAADEASDPLDDAIEANGGVFTI
jgi:hypothetical protein